jgi:hypothetical protein
MMNKNMPQGWGMFESETCLRDAAMFFDRLTSSPLY